MDERKNNNYAELCGIIAGSPVYSHESRGEKFYTFPLETKRLSGTADVLNVIARERIIRQLMPDDAGKVHVIGELRSFNNKRGEGSKLVITVFAQEIGFDDCEDINDIVLCGTICKTPNLRTTPMGRDICDFMLAVNRHYGRSDYLPCIAWGSLARTCAELEVGDSLTLTGRLQSRTYRKLIGDREEERTAYEISVIALEPVREKE